jgi:sulfate/thiosulfate transport system ATP-binding protein
MSIVLEQLTKRYAGDPVVNRVALEIADGEFFVLIGPSGSGKSTVLRMIAGLNTVDEGRVWLHGRDVTFARPQDRNVGFVFQHYALFKHMSVADNIEFALRVRRQPAVARRRRRDELLELVGLAGLGKRMPTQLSGGQQQRVALARALAHQPEVLLLDEPFGALDAKIRAELRRALITIQRELRITTILVTHDQEEAFELADRLGVMNFGRLLEVGAPGELYQHPQTEFVATFLGQGNLLAGEYSTGKVTVGPLSFPLVTETASLNTPQPVQVLFRPEDVALAANPEDLSVTQLGQGTIEQTTFSGAWERARVRLPTAPGLRPIAPALPYGEDSFVVEASRPLEQARKVPLAAGDPVWVGVNRIHVLAHRGFSFLIPFDGSPESHAALALGGQMARLAHARVTLLGYGRSSETLGPLLQTAREGLGSGLAGLEMRSVTASLVLAVAHETERQSYDMVIVGCPAAQRATLAERLLADGPHHLLLTSQAQPLPSRALVSARGGEPGKEEVLFAGSLLHYLGAQATLMSVAPADAPVRRARTEHFLADGARTLSALGVPTETTLATEPVREAILEQLTNGKHDLLLLGAPLARADRQFTLSGVVAQLLEAPLTQPVLVVRSRFVEGQPGYTTPDGRIRIIEEYAA